MENLSPERVERDVRSDVGGTTVVSLDLSQPEGSLRPGGSTQGGGPPSEAAPSLLGEQAPSLAMIGSFVKVGSTSGAASEFEVLPMPGDENPL